MGGLPGERQVPPASSLRAEITPGGNVYETSSVIKSAECGIAIEFRGAIPTNESKEKVLMRKAIPLLGLILFVSLSASAQASKFEIFGGYTYVHSDSTDNTVSSGNGGSADAGFFPTKHFGVIADLGAEYSRSFTVPIAGEAITYHASTTDIHYLAGPRIRYGDGPVSFYFQTLAGGVTRSAITDSDSSDEFLFPGFGTVGGPTVPYTIAPSATSWAVEPAIGVDLKLGRHWAIRLAQVGDTLTNFPSVRTGNSELQYALTLSSGIVWAQRAQSINDTGIPPASLCASG
jgi:hypothetical protein